MSYKLLRISNVEVLRLHKDFVLICGRIEVEISEGFDLVDVGMDVGTHQSEGLDCGEDD